MALARLYDIFEHDTRAGLLFDLVLILLVLASVAVVILDSVQSMERYEALFDVLEWGFTLLFTVEYVLRLACVRHPWRYATSFYGIVDLLAVLPTYLVFFVPEVNSLINLRLLRLLRIFRLLKLSEYVSELASLGVALRVERAQDRRLPWLRADHRCGPRDRDVRRRGPRERLHQHSGGDVLGHHHDDYGWLRRYHAKD